MDFTLELHPHRIHLPRPPPCLRPTPSSPTSPSGASPCHGLSRGSPSIAAGRGMDVSIFPAGSRIAGSRPRRQSRCHLVRVRGRQRAWRR